MGNASHTVCAPLCQPQGGSASRNDGVAHHDESVLDFVENIHCGPRAVACLDSACQAQSKSLAGLQNGGSNESASRPGNVNLFGDGALNANPKCRSILLKPHTQFSFYNSYVVAGKVGEGSYGEIYFARHSSRNENPQNVPPDLTHGQEEAGDVLPTTTQPTSPLSPVHTTKEQTRGAAVKMFSVISNHVDAQKMAERKIKVRMSFEVERHMLESLEHPHIVRMHECFAESYARCIILEMCWGGELYSRIVSRSRDDGVAGFEETLARCFFRQMLVAVAYLHHRSIVHRDLKPENFILLGATETSDADILKLADFGTAVLLSKSRPRSLENIGTLSYTAPEVYLYKGAACIADCWSLGVVLYVLLTGANPFRSAGMSRDETVHRIRRGSYERRRQSWTRASENSRDVVQNLLQLDELKRLSCVAVFCKPWFEEVGRPDPWKANVSNSNSPRLRAADMHALILGLPRLSDVQRHQLSACAMVITETDLITSIRWRDVFMSMDADLDGRVSPVEMVVFLRYLVQSSDVPGAKLAKSSRANPLTDEEMLLCAKALDLDDSGYVEWVEFLALGALVSASALGSFYTQIPLSAAIRLLRPSPLSGFEKAPTTDSGHDVGRPADARTNAETNALETIPPSLASLQELFRPGFFSRLVS